MKKVPRSKDELERQKLELEIRELERKWWQRPVYLSILLPVALAALTVLTGILSGYFNRERKQLASDIEALKREKNALVQNVNDLATKNKEDLKELNKVNVESLKLFKELDEYRDSHAEELKLKRKPKPSPSPN